MSELQNYYDNFANAGVWKHPNPSKCGCRGGGWFCSEVDTVHKCSLHNVGQPHPEDGEEEWDAWTALVAKVNLFAPMPTDRDAPPWV